MHKGSNCFAWQAAGKKEASDEEADLEAMQREGFLHGEGVLAAVMISELCLRLQRSSVAPSAEQISSTCCVELQLSITAHSSRLVGNRSAMRLKGTTTVA